MMKRKLFAVLLGLLLLLLSGCSADAALGAAPKPRPDFPTERAAQPPFESPSQPPPETPASEAPSPIPSELPSQPPPEAPVPEAPPPIPSEPPSDTSILVSILESKGFTVENNSRYVEPGEDAVFLLKLDSGYSLADTDYDGVYRAVVKGRQVELTLENVRRPTSVALRLTSRYCSITYEPNGGIGKKLTVSYDTVNHLRPNTSNGVDRFSREGCTLASWNTRPDGTGERVGLGSRVSVTTEGLTLYAQWAEWSAAADFTYRIDGEAVTVTGYHGSDSTVAIPAVIDGREVAGIASGAFCGSAVTELVLPITMQTVEDGAFQNCALKTVTLFDNIESIGDAGATSPTPA